jgi:hypothetical protein
MVGLNDFKKKGAPAKKTPDWFDEAPTPIKKFYWYALDIFEEKKIIISSSKNLKVRDLEVSITEVTALDGKSRSAIRKDRHGYFIEFLGTLTSQLKILWKIKEEKQADYRSRADVIEENRKLKLALATEQSKNLVAYCQESISNHTTKNMQDLQKKLKQADIDLDSAYETIANLRQGSNTLIKQLNEPR